MTSKEFAEKYAGKESIVFGFPIKHYDSRHNGTIGKIIGYGNPGISPQNEEVYDIWVEIVGKHSLDITWKPDVYVVPEKEVYGTLRRFPMNKLKVEVPDDCLECGAIGDEECRDGCRNKNELI